MARDASELARRLAREAEAVCRHYLSNGKREGRYWLVGDVHNTPGRSLFVRLHELAERTGRQMDRCRDRRTWRSCSTSSAKALGFRDFRDVAEEARRFLNLPRLLNRNLPRNRCVQPAAARIAGGGKTPVCDFATDRRDLVETLSAPSRNSSTCTTAAACASIRAATTMGLMSTLPTETWPAMIACVTDLDGTHHRRAPHVARSRWI